MSTARTTVPADLADARVLDEEGGEHRLGDAWRERPVVLAFVRHFGWMFCREHVVQLHHHIDRIHAAGGELVVVGSGAPNFVRGFREVTKYDGVLYTDPSLKAYDAAHLKRAMWRAFHPLSAIPAARTLARGFKQGSVQGSPDQQGGVFVIVPPDGVAFAHVSDRPGDNATPDEVVGALEHAVGKTA